MSDQINHKIEIPLINGDPISLELQPGEVLFLLGANGSGKSAMMHSIFESNNRFSKKILAQRNVVIPSPAVDISKNRKIQIDNNIQRVDIEIDSIYKPSYLNDRVDLILYNLINAYNLQTRNAFEIKRKQNTLESDRLFTLPTPIDRINDLFNISNLPIVLSLTEDDVLLVNKENTDQYSIQRLSDGERNALLICAEVLTTDSGSLLIIDEPERHLHRSIISPLISNLIQIRKDCTFVISTHDCNLPIDVEKSKVVILRGCSWKDNKVEKWNADLVKNIEVIPDEIKFEILGAKKKVLFVEGEKSSLDFKLYSLLFPEVTVIPVGGCDEVKKAVKGLRETKDINWVQAFGLIDADFRNDEDKEKLLVDNIATLDCYSVENLYYNITTLKEVKSFESEDSEIDFGSFMLEVELKLDSIFSKNKEKLCQMFVTAEVEQLKKTAKVEDFTKKLTLEYDLPFLLKEKIEGFEMLLQKKDFDTIFKKYSLKGNRLPTDISRILNIERSKFETKVRKLIREKSELKVYFKKRLSNLTGLIENSDNAKIEDKNLVNKNLDFYSNENTEVISPIPSMSNPTASKIQR